MIKTNSIRILPENVTNKIAAGEVIERPASIVKELLENSIDARSKKITVSVKNGGKSFIKVLDDGIGMVHDDTILSFERHATSKISTIDDFNVIKTFGFRGEALPSIASISRLKLISKTAEEETGTQVVIEGGEIKDVTKVASLAGTSMEVNNIFFNTPARKKFLKSDLTEMSYISQIFNTISLAYPNIQFRLINSDKEIINSQASGDLMVRIGDLFGKSLVKDLISISVEVNKMKLSGYISRPSFNTSRKQYQFFYVNNRCIKNKMSNHAIYNAYRTLLPKDRHPVLFLFFDISPTAVDVNVHPAKAEVRFANQQLAYDFIYHAIFKTLLNYKELQSKDISHVPETTLNTNINNFVPKSGEDKDSFFNKGFFSSFKHNEQEIRSSAVPSLEKYLDLNMPPPTTKHYPAYSKCRPVGQIEDSFIVLENSSYMVLVDQHTAHERILFEKLERELQKSKIARQQLLFPVSIELSHSESILLEKHLEDIKRIGLEIECFGKNSFLIRAVPSILEGKDYSALVLEIVGIISRAEKSGSFEHIFSETIKIIACHGAVRAHQHLKIEEIKNLLLDLEKTKLPYTCPHGRPISLVFSLKDIKKKFLRI